MGFDSQIVRFMACSAAYLLGPVSTLQEPCTIERPLAQCSQEAATRESKMHLLFLNKRSNPASDAAPG
jgi:hypothetical protein